MIAEHITDVLTGPERVVYLKQEFKNKYEVISHVLDLCLIGTPSLEHRNSIQADMRAHEDSLSTGIGLGIALPHCSCKYIENALGFLVILKKEINFSSLDEEPVSIIMLLVLPERKFSKHIALLASIARIFNDITTRENILTLGDEPTSIYKVITKAQEKLIK